MIHEGSPVMDLPGLVLSSLDHDALWCDLGLAIKALITHNADRE